MDRVIIPSNSEGVWQECSQCHSAVCHGFQVCQHCGHVISAEQQQYLRKTLGKNVALFSLKALAVFSLVFYLAYSLLGG